MNAPRAAATVIVGRDASELEVLLVKRTPRSRSWAGLYVFPGGTVEGPDEDAANQWCEGFADGAQRCAAVRETFEETGLLIGASAAAEAMLREERDVLSENAEKFWDRLAAVAADVAAPDLVSLAHWITPSAEKRRFSARFYWYRHHASLEATADGRETTELRWRAPAGGLADYRAGDVDLAPPTLRMLEDLALRAVNGDVEELVARRAFGTIMPKIVKNSDGVSILLPWHPDYGSAEGEAHPFDVDPGGYGPPTIVLKGERWRSC